MRKLEVNPAKLRSEAERLRGLNNELRREKEQLVNDERHLHGMWEGDAKQAFEREFHKDVQYIDQLIGLIKKYIDTLLQIAKEYEDAERANQAIAAQRKA